MNISLKLRYAFLINILKLFFKRNSFLLIIKIKKIYALFLKLIIINSFFKNILFNIFTSI